MIDMHVHLDLFPNPQQVAEECHRAGMDILSVTTTPRAWRGTSNLACGRGRIRTAVGLHPELILQREGEIPELLKLLEQVKYVGEIGIDGGLGKHATAVQRKAFDRILLGCAESGPHVLSVHSRRATTMVLDALEAHPGYGTAILHWFTGTPAELRRAVALGCWFSVGPAMTATKKGRTNVEHIPPNRIVTESDGPFGKIRGRTLYPWDVSIAEAHLAEIWDLTGGKARERVRANFATLDNALE